MSVSKVVTSLVLLLINLHSTNAACQLATAVVVDSSTTALTASAGSYTTLANRDSLCQEACDACGQNLAGAGSATAKTGLITEASIQTVGASICPTIAYTATAAADATNLPMIGVGTLITGVASTTGNPQTSAGRFTNNAVANVVASVVNVNGQYICPCVVSGTGAATNNCATCGCQDLGLPTSAPTAAPTTFPTSIDSASVVVVDDSGTTSLSFNDDALSAGDIAGIVIGAVGGAFLFLLVGVLVGGMVGGKSTAAAAPAGQL